MFDKKWLEFSLYEDTAFQRERNRTLQATPFNAPV